MNTPGATARSCESINGTAPLARASRPRLIPESDRKKHLAAAKRWTSRQKAAHGRPEKLRCHDQAMRHLYLALGHTPRTPGALL